MAIDTRSKRASALAAGLLFLVHLPTPAGTIAAADRRHVTGLYREFAPGVPLIPIASIHTSDLGSHGPSVDGVETTGPRTAGLTSHGPRVTNVESA